jgi:hypothetical protein
MEKELSCEQKVKINESKGKGSLEQEKNNEKKGVERMGRRKS